MTTRVLFYGLYMDTSLLESLRLAPRPVGAARLDDYQLCIGARATLVPAAGKSSYGVLIDLPDEQVTELYARPEVDGYVPREVTAVRLEDGSSHRASCYVLPPEEAGSGANVEYAAKLATLAERLGLPPEYVNEIEGLAGAH